MTETTAKKYFGEEEALGQTLRLDDTWDFIITAVIEDLPHNSHFQFDFLMPITIFNEIGGNLENWNLWAFHTYVLLDEPANHQLVSAKIADVITRNNDRLPSRLFLQPLTDIHLKSEFEGDVIGLGDITYIYLLSAIALFILVIACINFMNLTTAVASKRAKEVGMRKVVGAVKGNLIRQFLGESLLLTFIALLIALAMVELLLPVFNDLSSKQLSWNTIGVGKIIIGLVSIAIVTGFVSGSYPAFFLSSFQPVNVLKGTIRGYKGKSFFRKATVIFQFTLSVSLIISTIVVYNQLRFIGNKKLGFDKENLVYINTAGQLGIPPRFESVKQEFMNIPGVEGVTSILQLPPDVYYVTNNLNWEGRDNDKQEMIRFIATEQDFADVFKVPVLQGRSFSRDFPADTASILINQSAAKLMGYDNPLGKQVTAPNQDQEINTFTIIGVVEDFHFRSLHEEVTPLVVFLNNQFFNYIVLRINMDDVAVTMAQLRKITKEVLPEFPLDFRFLDEDFDAAYRAEQRLGSLARYATLLAIFISCMGLFGLASHTAEQRTKEIGVRKVLGASVSNVVLHLSKEFAFWVIIANLIAWPLAYYAMNQWLENFAYRIDLELSTFVLAGVLALVIAFITVSFQAVKAATANPVDALRYE
jgi:ABC-type antimicrobial peptide transport system permease subunit